MLDMISDDEEKKQLKPESLLSSSLESATSEIEEFMNNSNLENGGSPMIHPKRITVSSTSLQLRRQTKSDMERSKSEEKIRRKPEINVESPSIGSML